MSGADWIRREGGVAHSSQVRAAGFTPHDIGRAVAQEGVHRVRRSWLVAEGCDPRREAAARISGRVTCVTAAAMRGLWTQDHAEIHVAVGGGASRFDATGLRVHWAQGPAPAGHADVDDHILNVLFHVARCRPRSEGLMIWESAIRRGLTDADTLRRVAWRSERARVLASVATQLSDSGIETRFVDLLRSAGITVRLQVWIDGHPVDGLIGDRLVVRLDGFSHHRSARDRRRDLRADGRLVLRGYAELRFDYEQILFEPAYVLDTVLTAMAQGLHRIS
jgi:very-short-patch-repair endonuclease